MEYSKRTYLCFLVSCISLNIQGIESANIFIIEAPYESDTALLDNYDDYDPVDASYEYDINQKDVSTFFNTVRDNIDYYLLDLIQDNRDGIQDHRHLCQKLFGRMLEKDHFKCLEGIEGLKKYKRSLDRENSKRVNDYRGQHEGVRSKDLKNPKRNSDYKNQGVVSKARKNQKGESDYRSQDNSAPSKASRFSQDYIDIQDLARSGSFSRDYLDIGDFRSVAVPNCRLEIDGTGKITNPNCVLPSRRAGLSIEDVKSSPDSKVTSVSTATSSDSSSSEEAQQPTLRVGKKPKRFQVISEIDDSISDDSEHSSSEEKLAQRDDKSDDKSDESSQVESKKVASSDDSEEADLSAENLVANDKIGSVSSESSSSDSIETTTKASKAKSKKKAKPSKAEVDDDKYEYLQGNNFYNADDFRRSYYRLPYFLPKRYHWKEEEYQRLGSFWFDGPRGD